MQSIKIQNIRTKNKKLYFKYNKNYSYFLLFKYRKILQICYNL